MTATVEPDRIAELWEAYYADGFRVAVTLARDPNLAEDLVADAFLAVIDTMAKGNQVLHFRAYLRQAIRFRWYNECERNASRRRHEMAWYWEDLVYDASPPFGDDEVAAVGPVFDGLPEESRRVLWETAVEGRTPAQLAPVYGRSPNAVAALAMRARRAFIEGWTGEPHPTRLEENRRRREAVAAENPRGPYAWKKEAA